MKLIKAFALSALAFSSFNAAAQAVSPLTHNILVTATNAATCAVSGTPTASIDFDLSSGGVKDSNVTFAIECNATGLTPSVTATDATWTLAGGAPADAVAVFAASPDAGVTFNKVGGAGVNLTEGATAAGLTSYEFATAPKVYFGVGPLVDGADVSTLTAPSTAAGNYTGQNITLTVTF